MILGTASEFWEFKIRIMGQSEALGIYPPPQTTSTLAELA